MARQAPGVRCLGADDPLAGEVRWALTQVFGLTASRAQALIADPRRGWLLRADPDLGLVGFACFRRCEQQLRSAENAFAGRARAAVDHPDLEAFSLERLWYRGGDFGPERVAAELLPAMLRRLDAEPGPRALLCQVPAGGEGQAWRTLLDACGFEAGAATFFDFDVALDALPELPRAAELPPELRLLSFTQPPDAAALAAAHLEVFAAPGTGRADLDVARVMTDPDFAADLSPWLARGDEVAGFAWVFREDPGAARLGLVGVRPAWRGHGLARACAGPFLAACRAAGVRRLVFSIAADNPAPLMIAQALRLGAGQARRSYVWTSCHSEKALVEPEGAV